MEETEVDPKAEPKVEHTWKPPERGSDQAPGEETVQVNDPYAGGGKPPAREPSLENEQHPTGG